MIALLIRRRARAAERGQSLVEMALILPLLVLIVLGTLEFGLAFDHHLTLEYATREGARAGAALANGGGVCNGDPVNPANLVDKRVIASVQRVLDSPGSPVGLGDVEAIHIYRAGDDGQELSVNVWDYSASVVETVDGIGLHFSQQSVNWAACSRNNSAVNTHSLGVSITYRYDYQTPYAFLFGEEGLTMRDRTVMQLNPTN